MKRQRHHRHYLAIGPLTVGTVRLSGCHRVSRALLASLQERRTAIGGRGGVMSEFANPLPPPPRRAGGSKQLSNQDFKKILATPRPGARSQLASLPAGTVVGGAEDGGRQSYGGVRGGGDAKAGKPKKKWKPKEEEKEEEDEGPKYRDRAKERRDGNLADYDGPNADLAALMPEGQAELDVSKISVEESKFLGGDVEHTHLVKGLDFALLNKVRGDERPGKEKAEEEQQAQAPKPAMRFLTPMGRAVYRAVVEAPAPLPVDSFLPGRMAFLYSFEEDDLGNPPPDAPTTLRRSKADCPKLPPIMYGGMDRPLLERVAKVMRYVQLAPGGKKSKLKKKERARILGEYATDSAVANKFKEPAPAVTAAAAAAAAAVGGADPDSDEDIFGDVGRDYVCDVGEAPPKDKSKAAGGYFDSKDDMDDLPPMQGPARPPSGAAVNYSFQDDDGNQDMEVEGDGGEELPPPPPMSAADAAPAATTAKPKKPKQPELKGFAEEAYAECFPEYHDMAAEIVDSDDEGGADKMDLGRQGKVKTRADFSTEEEYNNYKNSQEANPKAAFQFGVKRGAGRKSSAALGKKNPDSQVNSELGKIKNILQEKGHDKDMVAFDAPRDEPAGGAPKRRRRV